MAVQRLLAGLFLGVFLSAAHADQASDVEAFKAAYSAYQDFEASGDFEHATPAAKTAYEIGLWLYGDEHENSAALAYNYGLMLIEVGDKPEARIILKQAVKLHEKVYGNDSVELIPVLMDLGIAKSVLGQPDRYRTEFDRALKLAREHYGPESARYGSLLLDVGVNIFNIEQSPYARKYLKEAHRILSDTLGDDDPTTGYAAFQLARFEVATKQFAEAETHLLAALQTFEDPERPSSMVEMSTHAWLVSVYEELGESEKATAHCQAIGRMTPVDDEQEYLPLFRTHPKYPWTAQIDGREGYIDVSFTVDHEGIVRDPEVIDGNKRFANASLEAVRTWRYAPRFVDGEPVSTPNVKTRLTYQFSD